MTIEEREISLVSVLQWSERTEPCILLCSCDIDCVPYQLTINQYINKFVMQGMAMVIGGLKHQIQRFNPQSVGVSATLMFVSVTGR